MAHPVVNGYLVVPYFFDGNVDRHIYLELLRDHLPGLLENVDLAARQRMWLQQDRAPPHFALIVREFLNLNFNEYIKNVVFAQRPTTREDLMERIQSLRSHLSRNFAENYGRF